VVTAIVLKANGSVAWIQSANVDAADRDVPLLEVRKESAAERGGNVLLDIGAGIGPRSLKLTPDGASLSWTRGGASHTATLG
jgi:hypothetical protein